MSDTTRIALLLVIFASACGADQPAGPSEEQRAEWRVQIDAAESEAERRQSEWHRAISTALEDADPLLGGECTRQPDYPFERFGADAWTETTVSRWGEEVRAARARWAQRRIRGARNAVSDGSTMLDFYMTDVVDIASGQAWTTDLVVVVVDRQVPVQGDDGEFTPGWLTVRALLYSYPEESVVCQGIYRVTSGSTIEMTFETWGTEQENRATQERLHEAVPNSELMSSIVELDLFRRAHYAAERHLGAIPSAGSTTP